MKKSILFKNDKLYILDQRHLPLKEIYLEITSLREAYWAIRMLKVRGAPLIGVFAAYAVYIALKKTDTKAYFYKRLNNAVERLKISRPTAVNLFWALERVRERLISFKEQDIALSVLKRKAKEIAFEIHNEDKKLCDLIASYGLGLISDNDNILTHCNSGLLATAGVGTALGIIHKACKKYKDITVYADETRPLLQGARLSAWELAKNKINVVLICDNMAGFLMQKGEVNKIIVGADRIAANGDTANKIGTYSLAVLAKYHKIPFYVAAPFSTFDFNLKDGGNIPIEQRDPDEVRSIFGKCRLAPKYIKVWNPAFDVTPAKFITAIITDKGIIYPPFKKNIRKILSL